jgi:hypothetical protein
LCEDTVVNFLKEHREFHQSEFVLPFKFVIVSRENGEVEERIDLR